LQLLARLQNTDKLCRRLCRLSGGRWYGNECDSSVRESLATKGAGVGAVAGMGAHVTCQVAGLRKGVSESGAGVGTVARMDSYMNRQAAWRTASLSADCALQNVNRVLRLARPPLA
jgi:hypothetical protein